MNVRELNPEDASAFWALRLRGFREDPTSFGSSFEESSLLPPEHAAGILSRHGRSPDDFVLGAFSDDALVGIVGMQRELRKKRAHRASVWGMYVALEARGQGLARTLMASLITRARATPGIEQLNLTVMAHNTAAVTLYQSLGFELWGHEKRAMSLNGVYYDEYSMGLQL